MDTGQLAVRIWCFEVNSPKNFKIDAIDRQLSTRAANSHCSDDCSFVLLETLGSSHSQYGLGE